MALSFRALALAAVALAGTAAGWRVLGELFSDPDDPLISGMIAVNNAWPWEHPGLDHPPELPPVSLESWWRQSPLVLAWNEISQPFRQLFEVRAFTQFIYLLCCALWSLLVWSFFGGAITRQAAIAVAREENVAWGPLASFVRARLGSYFVAPLFPLLGAFLAAGGLAVLGALMSWDLGLLIGGVLWPLVLLGGFVMTFLLLGLFFAWPLMWAAISAEGTDSFGALSHAYSYAYQRPLRYLLYIATAGLVGVLGWILVSLFFVWIVRLTTWAVGWGYGGDVIALAAAGEDATVLAGAGLALVRFWSHALRTLAFGFLFSYFWCSSTIIYFLLRRLVDATEIDEVHMPDEQLHGLPPLKTGPDGVPAAADLTP